MRVAALIIAGVATACSFGLHGPHRRSPAAPVECDDSQLLPTMDVVATVLSSIGAAGYLGLAGGSDDAAGSDRRRNALVAAGALAVEAVVFAISAAHGYRATAECRAARYRDPPLALIPR